MTRFPVPEFQREPGANENLSETSLNSIIFLFQILMALSLQNAAYIFITGGNSSTEIRPWSSFNAYNIAIFITFVATLIPFAHANVIILSQSYMAGFRGKGLQPLIDFVLLFTESGIFYLLSNTFTKIDKDYLIFFQIVGAILALDIVWALFTFLIDTNRRVVLIYALLNSATLGIGFIGIMQKVANLGLVLLVALALRTILDYSLTYNLLFPGAFVRNRRSPKTPTSSVRGV